MSSFKPETYTTPPPIPSLAGYVVDLFFKNPKESSSLRKVYALKIQI